MKYDMRDLWGKNKKGNHIIMIFNIGFPCQNFSNVQQYKKLTSRLVLVGNNG